MDQSKLAFTYVHKVFNNDMAAKIENLHENCYLVGMEWKFGGVSVLFERISEFLVTGGGFSSYPPVRKTL